MVTQSTTAGVSSGFTVIELMIVVVVVGMLALVAVPTFTNLVAKNRVRAASSNLHLAMLKARSEAAKRNATITITPNAGGWVSGWNVQVGATNLAVEGPATGVTITTDPSPLPSITYLSSGRVQNGNVTFEIDDSGNVLAPAHSRCVSVSLSGSPVVREGVCP